MDGLFVRVGIGLALPVLLVLALRSIPFVLPSYLFYAAASTSLIAAVATVRPMPALWMPTRAVAASVLLVAVLMAIVAVCWPLAREHRTPTTGALDRLMPMFDAAERHEVIVDAPPERVWQAMHETTLADVPAARWLMRVRLAAVGALRPVERDVAQRLVDVLLSPESGFVLLSVDPPQEIIVGMAGRPWARTCPVAPSDGAAFAAYADPGAVRIVMNVVLTPARGGTALSTETRIVGTDPTGTRRFGRYWRVVYPGSALMRQVWLNAIARRARCRA